MRKDYAKKLQEDITSQRKFGKLKIVEITERREQRNIVVKCLCDCGNECFARVNTLRTGLTVSCGCVKIANAKINGKLAVPIMIDRGLWSENARIGTAKHAFKHTYADGNLSFEDFYELSQKPCFYCGEEYSNEYNYYVKKRKIHQYSQERKDTGSFTYNGLDRVDNDLGHDKDNVVPCCYYCNRAKLDQTSEEFFERIKRIHKLHCEK